MQNRLFIKNQCELPNNQIEWPKPQKLLGEGTNAMVFQVKYQNKPVAIKLALSNAELDKVRQIINERRIFESFAFDKKKQMVPGAENIIGYHGHVYADQGIGLVIELATGGSLKAKILKHDLSPEEIRTLLGDIAAGLSALHAFGIIHCDVKLENVLLTYDKDGALHGKIMDLGLSRLQTEKPTYNGTPFYCAPEVIKYKSQTQKSDVYSMALALWELLSGLDIEIVYPVNTVQELYEKVIDDEIRPPIKPEFPKKIVPWLQKCWATSPADRPESKTCAQAFRALTDADMTDTVANNEEARRICNIKN